MGDQRSVELLVSNVEVHGVSPPVRTRRSVCCPKEGTMVLLGACAECADLHTDATDRVFCRFQGAPSSSEISVAEIMSHRVVTVEPNTPISTVVQILVDEKVSAVPVVDEDTRPVGVISKTDLVGHLSKDQTGALSAPASSVMTSPAAFLHRDAQIWEAAGLMAKRGRHRILVVSQTGELIGIVSALDVVRKLAHQEGWPSG